MVNIKLFFHNLFVNSRYRLISDIFFTTLVILIGCPILFTVIFIPTFVILLIKEEFKTLLIIIGIFILIYVILTCFTCPIFIFLYCEWIKPAYIFTEDEENEFKELEDVL